MRGPGSVTYGPGAVAGVISITTHTAGPEEGFKASLRYVNEYDSVGATLSYGYQSDQIDIFSFVSVTRTQGTEARNFQGSKNNSPGYIGESYEPNRRPLDYFGDFDDEPQIKAHVDATIRDNWRVWLRYTQQGSHWSGDEAKSDFGGPPINLQGSRDSQWVATLDYTDQIRDDLLLTAMLSADSSDVERRRENVRDPDPDHILNKKTDFSETEVLLRGVLNWQARDTIELAVGAEYSWDTFGPGWGDDEKDMRLGDDGVIVSGPDSNAIRPGNSASADRDGNVLYVGSGWDTSTFSLFSELNLSVRPGLTALFSTRIEKNTYTDWLFSPRLAILTEFPGNQTVKLIAQQAQRMNTAGQLYAINQNDGNSDPETIKTVELIYSARPNKDLTLSIAGFWNTLEAISWSNLENVTRHQGKLQTYGIEPELSFAWPRGKMGINYSLTKQWEWDLAAGELGSAISYSDFNQPLFLSAAVLTDEGNDLSNWANSSLKIFGQTELADNIVLHLNGRLQWDYQGSRDGLEGLRKAVEGLPQETEVLAALDTVKDNGTHEYQLRLNASLSWEPLKDLVVRVYAQNILDVQKNLRYSYDIGAVWPSPHRIRFIQEPRTFGVRVDRKF